MVVSIARASLLRIPRPSKVTNSNSILNLSEKFQGYHRYHGLSYISKQSASKGIHCFMGWNKKRKTVHTVWRPISTQSTSKEDSSLENMMTEPENIANVEQIEHDKCVASVVGAVADSTFSSSLLRAENEVGVAEGVQSTTGSTSQISFGDAEARKGSTVFSEKLSVSVEVGASVMRFIGLKDKSLRKGIEEMGVKIIYPSSKHEDSIVLEGDSMDVINKASEKIQSMIDEAVKTSAVGYSHLVSLPLAIHTELVDKLTRFQSTILAYGDSKGADGTVDVNSSDEASEDEEKSDLSIKSPDVAVKLKADDTNNVRRDMKGMPHISLVSYAPKTSSGLGIDKSIFNKPKTFHLTVLMLKLWNKGRVQAAKEVLQSVSSEIIEVLDNRPLFIRLKGLDCLRGSRTKAQVLYVPIEEIGNEGRLLHACPFTEIITNAYVKAGLVLEKDAKQKLKLHATVMNTTHRQGFYRKKHRKGKDSFDATAILEQFGSEQWGDYHIREAHLSQRFLYDDNGYYHCCTSIPFPAISEVPITSATPAESAEASTAESS